MPTDPSAPLKLIELEGSLTHRDIANLHSAFGAFVYFKNGNDEIQGKFIVTDRQLTREETISVLYPSLERDLRDSLKTKLPGQG